MKLSDNMVCFHIKYLNSNSLIRCDFYQFNQQLLQTTNFITTAILLPFVHHTPAVPNGTKETSIECRKFEIHIYHISMVMHMYNL